MELRNTRLTGLWLTLGLLGGCATYSNDGDRDQADSDRQTAHASLAATDVHPPLPATDARPEAPTEPADLWERMRSGFSLPPVDNPRVAAERQRYAASEAYWERIAERARPFMRHILDAIEDRGLPGEMALLPVVESAFRPFAYSHGSAAGLWQFIPATGRHYGLEQNWWYDGRRDVIASTEAALDYLERLGELFEGDWLLATAAYNAGEGTVLRAVRANADQGRPTDFWNLPLPAETRAYVPRLLALRDLVAAPDAHGISLKPLPLEPQIDVVSLDGQIDLALAADLGEMSIEELYRLNPGFNRWATPPEGPHDLVVPVDRVAALSRALAELSPEERLRWQRHEVAPGDTLIAISDHYHTRPELLREINDIDGSLIRVGDTLVVPVASRPRGDYSLSADQRRHAAGQRQRRGERRQHSVAPGESLWTISRRYDVGVEELARWNDMAPGDTLQPGRNLVVWGQASARPVGAAPADRLQSVKYTVRKGDSLYQIARRFRVTVADLRRWNGLSGGSYLQPGQSLKMEVDVTHQSSF